MCSPWAIVVLWGEPSIIRIIATSSSGAAKALIFIWEDLQMTGFKGLYRVRSRPHREHGLPVYRGASFARPWEGTGIPPGSESQNINHLQDGPKASKTKSAPCRPHFAQL